MGSVPCTFYLGVPGHFWLVAKVYPLACLKKQPAEWTRLDPWKKNKRRQDYAKKNQCPWRGKLGTRTDINGHTVDGSEIRRENHRLDVLNLVSNGIH